MIFLLVCLLSVCERGGEERTREGWHGEKRGREERLGDFLDEADVFLSL